MMAPSSVLAQLQDGEKHETDNRSVICSLVLLPLIATVVTSAGEMPNPPFRGNPSALHNNHRRLLQMQQTEQMFCSETGHNFVKISFKSQIGLWITLRITLLIFLNHIDTQT